MTFDADSWLSIGLTLSVVAIVGSAVGHAWLNTRQTVASAQDQLARQGHVRQIERRDGGGRVTRLWAPLPEPSPIYLRVSNNDGVALAMGDWFGVADLKVGDARFDGNFVVRSNFPDAAKAVLDDEMRRRLKRHRRIDFCTGAISNLLGPDHFPQQSKDRDLRTLWSLRVDGELSDDQCQPLLDLSKDLVTRLQAQAALGGFASEDYRVGKLEGL